MDRELTNPAQNPASPAATALALTPAACGWNALATTAHGEARSQQGSTFAEALAAGVALAEQPEKRPGKPVPVTVALPARLAVFERLTLPSGDREELTGMVRLQFEKSLPYPLEETAVAFQILSQTRTAAQSASSPESGEAADSEPLEQTTLLACGVHHPAAATLCAPLLEQRQYPQALTLWALHIAAQAPAGEIACGLWREEDQLLFGIFENRRLGFIETLTPSEDPLAALPRALMSAEMAGAPVEFHAVLIDPSLAALAQPLTAFLAAPVREFLPLGQSIEPPPGETLDFTPETWRADQTRQERFQRLRKQVSLGAALYAVLLILAFGYLAIQSTKLKALKKETASLQPQVDTVLEQQARWKALAPAIEQKRFALEILFQTFQSLPSPEARITQFDLSRNQLTVDGEMPTAQQAIAFAEKLKKRSELNAYRFESAPPILLPNDHAQFRIFGK